MKVKCGSRSKCVYHLDCSRPLNAMRFGGRQPTLLGNGHAHHCVRLRVGSE